MSKLNIALIKPNPIALRAVNKESEEYKGLLDSIRKVGLMNPISVRKQIEPEYKTEFYELIDGLHRYTAVCELGLPEIEVNILSLDEDQVLEAQIMANVHKIETKPVEYTKQLIKLLQRNPLMSINDLAGRLSKSPQWLEDRLSLGKITNPEIAAAINESKMPLANAYTLAKLPEAEQKNFLAQAMTMAASEFAPLIKARVKEINEAKRSGTEAVEAQFTAVEHLRKLGDLKEARTNGTAEKIVMNEGCVTPADGFKAALNWALNVDKSGVAAQKAADDDRKAAAAAAKKRRDEEKAAKIAAKAAEVATKAAEV